MNFSIPITSTKLFLVLSIYLDDEVKYYKMDQIKRDIDNEKYFNQSLDCINIVQSLHEIKLYVSYLLDKDQEYSDPYGKFFYFYLIPIKNST